MYVIILHYHIHRLWLYFAKMKEWIEPRHTHMHMSYCIATLVLNYLLRFIYLVSYVKPERLYDSIATHTKHERSSRLQCQTSHAKLLIKT